MSCLPGGSALSGHLHVLRSEAYPKSLGIKCQNLGMCPAPCVTLPASSVSIVSYLESHWSISSPDRDLPSVGKWWLSLRQENTWLAQERPREDTAR